MGDNLFCLFMIVSFVGLVILQQAVRKGWLEKLARRQLQKTAPDKRQRLIDRWHLFTLLTVNQCKALEAEFGLGQPQQEPVAASPAQEISLSRQQTEQASGQAVISASLPYSRRMAKFYAVHLQVLKLTAEVNLYRSAAGLPPRQVEL
jgi:hypothetical protein